MEQLLNAIWLLLTLAAFASWVAQSGGHERNRSRIPGLLILGCMLALLFPVISITDDLAAQQQLVLEDVSSTPSKGLQKGIDPGNTLDSQQAVTATLLSVPPDPVWHVLGYVCVERSAALHSLPASDQTGRAPPCFC